MADVIVIQGDSDEETVVIYSSGVPALNRELRDDGGIELRDDGGDRAKRLRSWQTKKQTGGRDTCSGCALQSILFLQLQMMQRERVYLFI
ncbi:MAG: hypothetical protein IPO39_18800 [Bacteroidetes bacterium]|nr:hypothetical protein [Bacteroidota bacterium]